MSGFSFDTDIVVDVLRGIDMARIELRRAVDQGKRLWISRMTWIDIMSNVSAGDPRALDRFLSGFSIDEIDSEIAERAVLLRQQRNRLRTHDAITLATALVRGRVLVTRNIKDFPAEMPGVRIPYTL